MNNENKYLDKIAAIYAPLPNYVNGVVTLILAHIWTLKNSTNESTEDLLQHSLWLGRLITLDSRVIDAQRQHEVEGWSVLRHKIIEAINSCQKQDDLGMMTASVMDMIGKTLNNRYQHDYRIPRREFNSWWFTMHNNNSVVALHLINGYQPQSPFSHLKAFSSDMLKALQHARKLHPLVTTVECGSWLNQFESFQQLWPASFLDDQKILNRTGGFGPGAWGQYMTADGGFLERNARYLIENGEHPFALTEAQCPIDELIKHLNKFSEKLEETY